MDEQTDRQKAMPKSPPCISKAGLKNEIRLRTITECLLLKLQSKITICQSVFPFQFIIAINASFHKLQCKVLQLLAWVVSISWTCWRSLWFTAVYAYLACNIKPSHHAALELSHAIYSFPSFSLLNTLTNLKYETFVDEQYRLCLDLDLFHSVCIHNACINYWYINKHTGFECLKIFIISQQCIKRPKGNII